MKHLLIGAILLYRRFISPMTPPCCRFSPTCSTYGLEAVRRFGFLRGVILTADRVRRCTISVTPGTEDSVPVTFQIPETENHHAH